MALILVVAGTLFLLLNIVQLFRTKKIIEYLLFKRVERFYESTVIDPNFHQK